MLDFLWIILLPTLCNYGLLALIWSAWKKKKSVDDTEKAKWNQWFWGFLVATAIAYVGSLIFWNYATESFYNAILALGIFQLLFLPLISLPIAICYFVKMRKADAEHKKKYSIPFLICAFIFVLVISILLIFVIGLAIGLQHM